MLLSTGNKSEIAVGYSTLYGDACGGFAPIKDLYKTEAYVLAAWRNTRCHAIPAHSITRPPSAELALGQTDQDQLPPYDVLDGMLRILIEGRGDVDACVSAGFEREMAEKIASMLRGAEHKRRQMPPGTKISPMLFSGDWRMPLTNKF